MESYDTYFSCDNKLIPCTVRFSKRIMRYKIAVSQLGVEVVVPARMGTPEAVTLIDKHRAWICTQVKRIERIKVKQGSAPVEPGSILYQGSPYAINIMHRDSTKSHVKIDERSQIVIVTLPKKSKIKPLAVLESKFRSLSKTALMDSVQKRADQIAVKPSRLTIRDQRTRWGSCSSRGTISLNWRLIMAPPEVLDYVVVHELCHMKEHNHSQAFWKLVESHCPDFKQLRKWLKVNGNRLRPTL